jgi:hypothetical protein
MAHNKSTVPDGFPIDFYQKFWELIKEDLDGTFCGLSTREALIYPVKIGYYTSSQVLWSNIYKEISSYLSLELLALKYHQAVDE